VSKDSIIKLIQPGNVDDQLTEILRNGARALLARAVEAEVVDFLGKHADPKAQDGHRRVVRHGHLPEREVMTGIGPVAVRQPRVRDREAAAADPDRIRFSPSILPPYMRRSKSIETLLRRAASSPTPWSSAARRPRRIARSRQASSRDSGPPYTMAAIAL
jgi:putative transposase